jgi:hypothetical protein
MGCYRGIEKRRTIVVILKEGLKEWLSKGKRVWGWQERYKAGGRLSLVREVTTGKSGQCVCKLSGGEVNIESGSRKQQVCNKR